MVNDMNTLEKQRAFWGKYITDNFSSIQSSIKKRFRDDVETFEDAFSFVMEKLCEDNMRRLLLYDPKRGARPDTYFNYLTICLIRRYFEKKNKKRVFPKWLRQTNHSLWMIVYELLCWKKMSETETFEHINGSIPKRQPEFINEAIKIIQLKFPNCAASDYDDIFEDNDIHDPGGKNPEELSIEQELMKIVLEILSEKNEFADSKDLSGFEQLKLKIRQKFSPSIEQRLFLRMVYQDGLNVAAAGRKLQWNKNQASGQNRRLLKKLRDILGNVLFE